MDNFTESNFNKERKKTDDSLHEERGKTDESFEDYKGRAESETDTLVIKNRLEADTARFKRRSEADMLREGVNASNLKNQTASERNIFTERESEDSAIQKERSKNDLAIEREREEKARLMNELFNLERQATDKNLLFERNKTDRESKNSANLLVNEQQAHGSTRSALTTREEFVAIVSHDLRNPIGAVLSSAELLLENPLIQDADQNVQRLVEIIKRNAETSLRLIKDILDMERIAGGVLKVEPISCSIQELLSNAIESNRHKAQLKSITLTSNLENASESMICDKDRINQVLSNLIGNAIKFTPQGGTITITAGQSENNNIISVQDTGPGVPEDQRDRIFERFAQIGNRNREGLGLGLYISKTLIEFHKGKLWVKSEPPNGSTFSFTIPK